MVYDVSEKMRANDLFCASFHAKAEQKNRPEMSKIAKRDVCKLFC
jgi:hypothetical protein